MNVVAPCRSILRKLPCWGTLVVAACLVTACDSGRETEPPAPKPFVYVEPPKPIATHVPAGMSAMIDQLAELREKIAELEMDLIRQALEMQDGVVARASELLGMRRTTLVEKMKKYGMTAKDM